MNYEHLLNKEDCRSYALLKYLENSFSLSEPISKIQTNLGFSNYILKKTTKKLKDDMEKYGISQNIHVVETQLQLSIKAGGKYTSRHLLMHYLQESLILKMVLAFYTGFFRSIEGFSEDNFISYSVGYHTLQTLKDTLKVYDISFEKRQISGDKNNIRSFLTSFFSLSNLPFASIYKYSTLMQTEKILNLLKKRYSLNHLENKKLFHYIAVYLELRGSPVEDNVDNNLFTTQSIDELKHFLALEENALTFQIISWLFINHKLEDSYLQKIDNHAACSLTNNFIEEFEAYFPNINVCYVQNLTCQLNLLHFNVLQKKIDVFEEFSERLFFLKESYPDYYYFLANYFEQVDNKLIGEQSRDYLFFNYLVMLINNISLSASSDKVKVMFDFSQGSQYNLFLQNVLSMNDKLSAGFTTSAQEADIIITDSHEAYSDDENAVLIWADPPRFIDWMQLARLLVKPFGSEKQNKQLGSYLLSEIIKRCVKSLDYTKI